MVDKDFGQYLNTFKFPKLETERDQAHYTKTLVNACVRVYRVTGRNGVLQFLFERGLDLFTDAHKAFDWVEQFYKENEAEIESKTDE